MGIAFLVLMVLGLGVSIAAHEAGHMYSAFMFKGKVRKFSVGFGPTLLKYTRKNTLYVFKLIPLYGYVNISGMQSSDEDKEHPGVEFRDMSVWAKSVILLGGVTLNCILSILLVIASFSFIGEQRGTSTVLEVGTCLNIAQCSPTRDTPAHVAGLAKGDTIKSINNEQVDNWYDVKQALALRSPGEMIEVSGERLNGDTFEVTVTLGDSPVHPGSAYLGASPVRRAYKYSLRESVSRAGKQIGQTTTLVTHYPEYIYSAFKGEGEVRLVGPVGLGRISSDIGEMDVSLTERLGTLLGLLALMNASLMVFNLIPILPFDGGRLVGVWIGAGRKLLYSLFNKKYSGPVNNGIANSISSLTLLLYVFSVLVLLVSDIVRPL